MKIRVNGKDFTIEAPPDTPLLWVIREELGLNGTKFGCGMALCGACTVHIDGQPVRSCVTPVSEATGREIVTIEAIGGPEAQAIERAWIAESVPQCGYCQAGQVMSAIALLRKKPNPSDSEIDSVMSANLCRCGTYQRIRKAIHRAAREVGEKK